MELAEAFNDVIALVREGKTPQVTWVRLLEYAARCGSGETIDSLKSISLDDFVIDIRKQLERIVADEPIPPGVDALYFGLFDAKDDETEEEYVGYYISGVKGFDPDDPDSLVDPVYFPENRFLRSKLLDKLHSLAVGDSDNSELFGYVLMIGATALLCKYAMPRLPKNCKLVVGFDDGDFAVL